MTPAEPERVFNEPSPVSANIKDETLEDWEDYGDESPRANTWQGDVYEDNYLEDTTRKPSSRVGAPPPAPTPTAPPAEKDTGESYEDLIKLREKADEDLILLESRRSNREDLVQYGLEEDPVGNQVAAKWNIPSSGKNREWEAFDRMAEEGVQAADRLNLGPEFERNRRQPSPPEDTKIVVGGIDADTQALYDLFRSAGYEMTDPKAPMKRYRRNRIRQAQGLPLEEEPEETSLPSPPPAVSDESFVPDASQFTGVPVRAAGKPSIQQLFAELGYQYDNPKENARRAKIVNEQQYVASPQFEPIPQETRPPSPPPTPTFSRERPPVAPPPTPQSPSRPPWVDDVVVTTAPLPVKPQATKARPPWADEMDRLYAQIIKNQHVAARRALGEKAYAEKYLNRDDVTGEVKPLDLIDPPFSKETRYSQDEVDRMSPEEVAQVLEVVRVNPDGTYTKVERGSGWPKPWKKGSG